MRTFSVTNFSRYELYLIRTFAYEPFSIRTFSFTNFRIRTFYIRTFSVTNILHMNLIRYEPFPLRTIAVTNLIPYEPYPIRTFAYEPLLTNLFPYEPCVYEPRSWNPPPPPSWARVNSGESPADRMCPVTDVAPFSPTYQIPSRTRARDTQDTVYSFYTCAKTFYISD